MKKLFFSLTTLIILCFAANSVNAQVQDTARRSNGNMGQQQGWPADSNKRDSITPAPNNPTTSDTTHRNNGLIVPSDKTDVPPHPPITPGTDTRPRPQTDMPNVPRPNMSPNSPTMPTTGAPM